MKPEQDPNTAPHAETGSALHAEPAIQHHHNKESFRPLTLGGLQASTFFLPHIRADLQTFYDTLACLRSIADQPDAIDETRDFLLDCCEQALTGSIPSEAEEPGVYTLAALRHSLVLQSGRLDAQWIQRLVQAARKDISRPRCTNWSDLLLYCRYAAEPLGRAVLQLHGITDPEVVRATDALCAALLILRLIRRTGADWRELGRCYLPTEWFAEEGASPEQLVEPFSSPAVRKIIGRTIDRAEQLLNLAFPLPRLLTDPRLKAEALRLQFIAQGQVRQLRREDPLLRPLKTPGSLKLHAHFRAWFLVRTGLAK